MSTEGTPQPRTAGPLAIRAPGGVLALLTALNLLNYVDRYVLSAVLPKIQDDLHLSNWVGGWLPTVFLIGYFATCPVFGTLADRAGTGGRARLLTAGIAVWSAATVATGLARGATALMASRAVVGVGEASYATIAPTLIDDLARPGAKTRWMSIFNAAMAVGAALGYVIGGAAEQAWGWHAAFFVAGGPGLAAALLCLFIAEPERRPRAEVTLVRAAGTLLRAPAYRGTVLGYCVYTFAIGGFAFWAPTFAHRNFGMPVGKASVEFGALTFVGGVVGTLAGGWLADLAAARAARRSTDPEAAALRANLAVCSLAAALGAPLAAAAILAPTSSLFFALALPCEVALFLSSGPVNVVLLRAAPPAQQASAMALAIFCIHAFGDMWSQPLIGLAADHAPWTSAMLIVPVFFAAASFVWWRTSAGLTGAGAVR